MAAYALPVPKVIPGYEGIGCRNKRGIMDNRNFLDNVADATGMKPDEVQTLIGEFSKLLAERCVEMDTVIIPGFGQFEARKRKERLTVHPATGQRLMVPPKLVLGFKPSGVLKAKL